MHVSGAFGEALFWSVAYGFVLFALALAVGQVRRRFLRKRFDIREHEKKIVEHLRAPRCFGDGDVLSPRGQAENGCHECIFFTPCLYQSQPRKD